MMHAVDITAMVMINERYRVEFDWLTHLGQVGAVTGHPNIVRAWAQFVDTIPPAISERLTDFFKERFEELSRGGMKPVKTHFAVLDYHPLTLRAWLQGKPPCVPPAQFYPKVLTPVPTPLHTHSVSSYIQSPFVLWR